MKKTYDIFGITDCGNVRADNQDSHLIRTGAAGDEEFCFLAVADGMGGMSHGEEASCTCVAVLETWWKTKVAEAWKQNAFDMEQLEQSLDEAIRETDSTLHAFFEQIGERGGTTLSAMFFFRDSYLCKHIGDSRIYRVTPDGWEQITRDHTLYEKKRMEGTLTPENEADESLRHTLVNALGIGKMQIDTYRGMAAASDRFLLCSDGFYEFMTARDFQTLAGEGSAQQKMTAVKDDIKSKEADDNLTGILLQKCGMERRTTVTLEPENDE
ncbi:Serine/threonine protein phosphatase PrpC [[Clostridium] aminophilum]|uniref:Serine/threonine protein phosphatase PrpC n=1 Tax=[Clostridium] aminophilum TaxID=1526 RepID=A0A1I0EJG5_9FIRM|nr:PP2C family serine/threonine-protein phosphatase [[Clostridium] aminophilum]SET45345.1 Serine/threonine protein phosphatase PrpC [[Clostridium] aminophilum]